MPFCGRMCCLVFLPCRPVRRVAGAACARIENTVYVRRGINGIVLSAIERVVAIVALVYVPADRGSAGRGVGAQSMTEVERVNTV